MTTNEELMTAISDVRGDVKALEATVKFHGEMAQEGHRLHQDRLNNHADRLRDQEQGFGNHLTRHSQTRWVVGLFLAIAGAVAGFWNRAGLGG